MNEMNKFHLDLNDIVARNGNENVIVLGDLNARVGCNNSMYADVLGKFGTNGSKCEWKESFGPLSGLGPGNF